MPRREVWGWKWMWEWIVSVYMAFKVLGMDELSQQESGKWVKWWGSPKAGGAEWGEAVSGTGQEVQEAAVKQQSQWDRDNQHKALSPVLWRGLRRWESRVQTPLSLIPTLGEQKDWFRCRAFYGMLQPCIQLDSDLPSGETIERYSPKFKPG